MRPGRFGAFLLGAGVVVGSTAVVGLVLGFEPSRLPPALLDVAAYKLTFLAAAGLLAAGAIIRRRANRAMDALPTVEALQRGREADRVRERPPTVRVTPPG